MPLRDPGSYCTLHTGNLLDYSALPRPQRKLSSSTKFSDELPSAINYLAKNDTPFSMTDRVYTPSTRVPSKPNKEVRCILKVCLSAMLPDYIEDAVRIARNTLHIKAISELIIAFPFAESMYLSDSAWMQQVRPVWAAAEDLVDKGFVRSIGVSDLDVNRLRLLCQDAKRHKPAIQHYSFDAMISCEVPSELFIYAEANGIQLATHDDPKNWVFSEDVLESINKITHSGTDVVTKWIAKYTCCVPETSQETAKGYFVHVTNKPAH
uniref:GCS light chain n=1 Tax=Haemonchus contortus TaxID=6289 RepID=A0A7I4YW72_HAECO|nr:glutamate-cysteine ligase modifier subunit [Haemonchus contortus]